MCKKDAKGIETKVVILPPAMAVFFPTVTVTAVVAMTILPAGGATHAISENPHTTSSIRTGVKQGCMQAHPEHIKGPSKHVHVHNNMHAQGPKSLKKRSK